MGLDVESHTQVNPLKNLERNVSVEIEQPVQIDKIRNNESSAFLRLGSSGDGVKWLKQELNKWAEKNNIPEEERLSPTNSTFNKKTDELLRKFQAANGIDSKDGSLTSAGLDTDGILGPRTMRALDLSAGREVMDFAQYKEMLPEYRYTRVAQNYDSYVSNKSVMSVLDSDYIPKDDKELVEHYASFLVKKRGGAPGQVVDWSHYDEPIDKSKALHGNSRRWGDADLVTQAKVVHEIVHGLKAQGFNKEEVAYALSLAKVESGFNPDACAGTTSACGTFQFIDKTRSNLEKRTGIKSDGTVAADVALFASLLKEQFDFAKSKGFEPGTTNYYKMAYAYHHDGASLKYGGFGIANKVVAHMAGIHASIDKPTSFG